MATFRTLSADEISALAQPNKTVDLGPYVDQIVAAEATLGTVADGPGFSQWAGFELDDDETRKAALRRLTIAALQRGRHVQVHPDSTASQVYWRLRPAPVARPKREQNGQVKVVSKGKSK